MCVRVCVCVCMCFVAKITQPVVGDVGVCMFVYVCVYVRMCVYVCVCCSKYNTACCG